MPCGCTIDLTRPLVLSRGWAVLTDREILAIAFGPLTNASDSWAELVSPRPLTDDVIPQSQSRERP
jgi:hypothetical protein